MNDEVKAAALSSSFIVPRSSFRCGWLVLAAGRPTFLLTPVGSMLVLLAAGVLRLSSPVPPMPALCGPAPCLASAPEAFDVALAFEAPEVAGASCAPQPASVQAQTTSAAVSNFLRMLFPPVWLIGEN